MGEQLTGPTRVLIVEWRVVMSSEIRSALDRDPEFEVVGEVAGAEEATRQARSSHPHVVLIDTGLPEPGAVELARFFRMRMPETVLAFMTPSTSQEELFEASRVGVAAYLRGRMDDRAFLDALRRAARGEFPIDDEVIRYPMVASRIMAQFRASASVAQPSSKPPPQVETRPAKPLAPLFVPLSAREIEILDLVAHGNSNKIIARRLGISDQTVKNHVSAILRKLEVNDRTEAVVYAIRSGWIHIDAPAASAA